MNMSLQVQILAIRLYGEVCTRSDTTADSTFGRKRTSRTNTLACTVDEKIIEVNSSLSWTELQNRRGNAKGYRFGRPAIAESKDEQASFQ